MIDHPYTPHPVPGFTNRDQCEYRLKDEPGICAEPRSAHVVISDLKPREPGCQCHKEEGDSPCKVHGEEKVHYHPDEIPCGPKWKCFTEPKSAHAAALLGRGEIQNPREGEPGDAETYEGKPLFEKGPKEPDGTCRRISWPHAKQGYCADWKPVVEPATDNHFEPRKRWPRKVGWTKLLARRKACKHVFTKGRVVASITFAADRCPRCLADEVAYWKGRTHSAEGQRQAMIGAVKDAISQVKEAQVLVAPSARAVAR